MVKEFSPQLRYLGVRPLEGHVEYGFRLEDKDKNVRLIVLTIEGAFFSKSELRLQEAPDLCYQKVLMHLQKQTVEAPMPSSIMVSALDVALYRELHPLTKPRRHPPRKSESRPTA
jgi:hypothetical protein